MDKELQYPDISRLALNSYAMECQSITHAVGELLSTKEQQRRAAQTYLQQLQYFDFTNFVNRMVAIITSPQVHAKDAHLCICYLRHALNSYKNSMGDLVPVLNQLCDQCPSHLRETAVRCLILYLNRPKNIQPRRAYVQSLIGALSTLKNTAMKDSINSSIAIDTKLLTRIIDVLGDKSFTKKSGLNFSNANQKLIHEIILKHSMGMRHQLMEGTTWVSVILALSNYSGFTPPIQFIYNHIAWKEVTSRQVIILSSMYNSIHLKFTIPEQIYNILRVQLERLHDCTLIETICNKQSYTQAQVYTILLKNISHAATDLLRQFKPSPSKNTATTPAVSAAKGTFASMPPIHQSSFLTVLIMQVLYRPQEECGEYEQLAIEAVTEIILSYKLNVNVDVHGFMQDICQALSQKKYGQQYLYLLISTLPSTILKQLDMGTIICSGVQRFIDSNNTLIVNDNANLHGLQCLLKMINSYMKVANTTYQPNGNQPVSASINNIMTMLLTSNNMLVISNTLKAHAFALLCRFHINAQSTQVLNVESVVAIGYQILISQTIINANDHLLLATHHNTRIDGQCTEVVVDSLKQLADTYKQLMYGCILNFLTASLVNSYQPHKIHIYGYFLDILHSCFQASYTDARLIAVLRQCYHSNNEALQSEASELVLTIAYKTNIFSKQNPQLSTFCQQVMTQLLTTGVLLYIQYNLMQQQDEILFTHILAELAIHQHIYPHVQNMLDRVCSHLPAWLHIHYHFDKIWEILVILYKTTNLFPERKLINKKIQNVYSGNIESLLESVTLDDAQQIKQRQEKLNLAQQNRIIHWSHLPEVRRLIKQGSVVGPFVDSVLQA